jgi:hypothetical protein
MEPPKEEKVENEAKAEGDIAPHEEVVEKSPRERYLRFKDLIGKGSYKEVWRARDSGARRFESPRGRAARRARAGARPRRGAARGRDAARPAPARVAEKPDRARRAGTTPSRASRSRGTS